MPSSSLYSIPSILSTIAEINPRSVLDIGIGFGKFGFLIREYFDLRPGKSGIYDKWTMKIDGIEIFEEYLTDVHKYIYNNIFIGDAQEILSKKNSYYDLIIAVDILEHFTKRDGYTFIEKAKGVSNNILISTPYIFFEQDEVFGNKKEKHLSGWNFQDLKKLDFTYCWKVGISMLGVYSKKKLTLPIGEEIEDNIFDSVDLKKISALLHLYFNTSQWKECIEAAEFYLSLFETNPIEPLTYLAISYDKIENKKQSIEYAKIIIKFDKNNKTAWDILKNK